MGRKKITIKPIGDEKLRNITFNKRKQGLLKKAAELSLLCNVKLCLSFTDVNGQIINFFSPTMDIIDDFQKTYSNKKIQNFTLDDYPNFARLGKYKKKDDKLQIKSKQPVATQTVETRFKEEKDSNQIIELTESAEKPNWHDKPDKIVERTLRTGLKRRIDFKKVLPPKKQPKKDLKITIPAKNKSLEYPMKIIKILNDMSNQGQEPSGEDHLSENNEAQVFTPDDTQIAQLNYESEYLMKKHMPNIEGAEQVQLDGKNELSDYNGQGMDSMQQNLMNREMINTGMRDPTNFKNLKNEINKSHLFSKPQLISGGYSYNNNYNQSTDLKSPYGNEIFNFIGPSSNDLLSNLQNGGGASTYYRPNYNLPPSSNPYSGQVPPPYYNFLAGNSGVPGNQGPQGPDKFLFEEETNYLQTLEGVNEESNKKL